MRRVRAIARAGAGAAGLVLAAAASAGTLTLKSTGSSATPSIIGYNHGYFAEGGNARAWWEYAGVNGVRIFISPSSIEPTDDLAPLGDGVTDDASFESRKDALRADPLNPAYIDWPDFEGHFESSGFDYALAGYHALNLHIMAQITASEDTRAGIPIS